MVIDGKLDLMMSQTTTKPKSKLATIVLLPNRFQVAGPTELITAIQVTCMNESTPIEELKYQIDCLYDNWHVICSVSGEEIPLSRLKYWDVPKQEVYARPELVPALHIRPNGADDSRDCDNEKHRRDK